MASCVKNILTKNYQNLIIGFHVTVKNVGDVFLRHSVEYNTDNDGRVDVKLLQLELVRSLHSLKLQELLSVCTSLTHVERSLCVSTDDSKLFVCLGQSFGALGERK